MSRCPALAVPALLVTLALTGTLAACGGDDGPTPDLSVESQGELGVATRWQTVTDGTRQRPLTIQVWYPTTAVESSLPITELEAEPRRTDYAGLLAQTDPGCATRTLTAARDAAPAPGTFPLVAFSHCHECTRYSGASIATRIASHGFVVVAVDHTGNTLWDRRDGTPLPLDATTLELRVGDLAFAVDQIRGGVGFEVVSAALDPTRTGVFGHSFGSVTAGLYAQRHPEVGAAFGLAAPMENPLLPGVTITEIEAPLGFLVAREDNSISELGNELIRGNFMRATGGSWKLEVADAGHWSVSDLVGLVPAFAPGCGAGTRQTDGQTFTYLDADSGRDIAASYVTAFFKATLGGDAGAQAYLETAHPAGTVTVEHR